jgi:hypothetical protein
MTPAQRQHIEKMVEPSWRKAGCSMQHGYRFQVYAREDLNPMSFAPSAYVPESRTYRVARLELQVLMHEGRQIRKLFAHVEGTAIKVLLSEDRE